MEKLTFIIDESGAKGFANKQESWLGELGVMAGLLIPSEKINKVESDIEALLSELKPSRKLHITELNPDEQRRLRERLYEYLSSVHAPWVYSAVYVQGLYSHHKMITEVAATAKARRQSKIKVSDNKRVPSLHHELFKGAFFKCLQFGLQVLGESMSIDVITDPVDATVLKGFNQAAHRILRGRTIESEWSGFDPEDRSIVRGSVSISVEATSQGMSSVDFPGIDYTITQSRSALTVAADVLANSTYYHLRRFQEENPGKPLNTAEAISGHPLADYCFAMTSQESGIPQVEDTFFKYPRSEP